MISKTKLILVIGPPGAGKGTQSKLLAQKTNRLHISTSDLLREAVADRTNVGKMVEPFINSRLLVPDDIVINIVTQFLNKQTSY